MVTPCFAQMKTPCAALNRATNDYECTEGGTASRMGREALTDRDHHEALPYRPRLPLSPAANVCWSHAYAKATHMAMTMVMFMPRGGRMPAAALPSRHAACGTRHWHSDLAEYAHTDVGWLCARA